MHCDIGTLLARARHSRGLTLSKASSLSRLRQDDLRHLERNQWRCFHSDSHARACLRVYSETLGLDAAEVLRKFDQSISGSQSDSPVPTAVSYLVPRKVVARTTEGLIGVRKRGLSWSSLAVVIGGLVVIGALMSCLFLMGGMMASR